MLLVKRDPRLKRSARPTVLLSQSLYHVLNYTDLRERYDNRVINAAINQLELKHIDARLKQHRIAEGIDRLFDVTRDHANTSALVQDFRSRYLDRAVYKALVMLCDRLVSPEFTQEKWQSLRNARGWHMLDEGNAEACDAYTRFTADYIKKVGHGK